MIFYMFKISNNEDYERKLEWCAQTIKLLLRVFENQLLEYFLVFQN